MRIHVGDEQLTAETQATVDRMTEMACAILEGADTNRARRAVDLMRGTATWSNRSREAMVAWPHVLEALADELATFAATEGVKLESVWFPETIAGWQAHATFMRRHALLFRRAKIGEV